MPASNYKNPPVSEVAFGLGFSQLVGLRASHYGLFWNQIRDEFPETDDQLPLISPEQLPLQFGPFGPLNRYPLPLPRAWYVHRDRNLLIQLQNNRIWLNWRRLGADSEYPRFPALLENFEKIVGHLRESIRAANVGLLAPAGYELTYVNHIPLAEPWARYDEIGGFMRDVSWHPNGRTLPRPETIGWNANFIVDGIRVLADVKAAKEQAGEQRPIFIFELRASSMDASPSTETLAGADFDWYRRAHTVIINAFKDLTTTEARYDHWLCTDPID
jgi:uncharacterized protein (TIGR04255 family)